MPWSAMDELLLQALSDATVRAFESIKSTFRLNTVRTTKLQYVTLKTGKEETSQAIANIIYSCGSMGAKWESLSPEMSQSLCRGIELWQGSLISQEVSNLIYG